MLVVEQGRIAIVPQTTVVMVDEVRLCDAVTVSLELTVLVVVAVAVVQTVLVELITQAVRAEMVS